MYEKYFKRILDILVSLICIIVFFPIFLMTAFMIYVKIGSPVIFKQRRVGKDEKVFVMYKFRTMTDAKDEFGKMLSDELRLTKLGRLLRSSSVDELPELFNVLRGDISIVGPRPLIEAYLPYYTEEEKVRHRVRGGLTVPEVLYGNVTPSWEDQFLYEVEYVNNVSFIMDIKIIIATIKILFLRIKNNYGAEVRKPLDVERKSKVQ